MAFLSCCVLLTLSGHCLNLGSEAVGIFKTELQASSGTEAANSKRELDATCNESAG